MLKKIYGGDFKGYTVKANFLRSSIPNSGAWTVSFLTPKEVPRKERVTKEYSVRLNSITGTVLHAAGFRDPVTNSILNDPAWQKKSKQAISVLIPANISISNSKVIAPLSKDGFTVIYELSDGSAYSYSVHLFGINSIEKGTYLYFEEETYIYFSRGYDGSLDQ